MSLGRRRFQLVAALDAPAPERCHVSLSVVEVGATNGSMIALYGLWFYEILKTPYKELEVVVAVVVQVEAILVVAAVLVAVVEVVVFLVVAVAVALAWH